MHFFNGPSTICLPSEMSIVEHGSADMRKLGKNIVDGSLLSTAVLF